MSNEFCLIQEPHLFVPSAFTPGGKNPVFMPSFIYVDPKNYQFLIFTRWGEKIFETQDPTEGWNGSKNNVGKPAPEGVYLYEVEWTTPKNEVKNKRDFLTLYR